MKSENRDTLGRVYFEIKRNNSATIQAYDDLSESQKEQCRYFAEKMFDFFMNDPRSFEILKDMPIAQNVGMRQVIAFNAVNAVERMNYEDLLKRK